MTPREFFDGIEGVSGLSRKSIILLAAYYLRKHAGFVEFRGCDIRRCFQDAYIKVPSDLTALLKQHAKGRGSPLLVTSSQRYAMSRDGLDEVETYLTSGDAPSEAARSYLASAVPHLEKVVSKVADENKRRFLAEAIACASIRAKRATIVMTWLATIDHMYDYVLSKKLNEFNGALSRRPGKTQTVASKDDLSEMKDSVFIEVCRSARVISNDVRKILEEKLGVRNTFAHPSDVELHDSKVVNFVEDLVDNVIVKYVI